MEENIISMHEIFSFDKKGIGPDGKVIGAFQPSHIRPKFLERLRISGYLPAVEPVRAGDGSQLRKAKGEEICYCCWCWYS